MDRKKAKLRSISRAGSDEGAKKKSKKQIRMEGEQLEMMELPETAIPLSVPKTKGKGVVKTLVLAINIDCT